MKTERIVEIMQKYNAGNNDLTYIIHRPNVDVIAAEISKEQEKEMKEAIKWIKEFKSLAIAINTIIPEIDQFIHKHENK